MKKLVVLFTVTMFLAVFALIGCNKPQEPPKTEETPAPEQAATPAPEQAATPAKKPAAKVKPLPKTGNVVIIVKDSFGNAPIKEAVVTVKVNEDMKWVKTNAAGKAQFNNLPVGSYSFGASAEARDLGSSMSDSTAVNVTVPPGATATRTITLRIKQ